MRRRRWLGAVLVPVGVVSLCVAQVALRSVPAQAVSTTTSQPGTAAAGANLLGVSPGVSSLTLTTTFGESSAALEHDESQSKSATIDLGSLGLVLATTSFCGRYSLPEKDQPQPLTADSDSGPFTATNGTGGVGQETVSAHRSPESASAATTSINETLPGIFSVNGSSNAQVSFVAGKGQVATSNVTETVSLLNGIVKLTGMHWQATNRAGSATTHTTHFSFGQVTFGGVPMKASTTSTASGIHAINTVLLPFGLSLLQPAQTTNARTGAVSIGPLTLRFSGSKIDRTLVSPAVNSVIDLEDLIAKQSKAGSNCADIHELLYNLGTNVESLLNVGLAISEGAGNLDVDFGGATASALDAADYSDPFGGGPGTTPSRGGGTGTSKPGSTVASGSSNPNPPGVEPVTGSGPAPVGTSPTVATPNTSLAASRVVCRSMSTAGSQHCWKGLATIASGAALATGIVLIALDVYVTRRRRPLLRRRYRRA